MNMTFKRVRLRIYIKKTAWLSSIYILHPPLLPICTLLLSCTIRSAPYTHHFLHPFSHKFNSPLRQWNKNYYYFLLIIFMKYWIKSLPSMSSENNFHFLSDCFPFFVSKWNFNLYLIESWKEFLRPFLNGKCSLIFRLLL